MRELNGKVAVVTGAGSGIGQAIAMRLATEGVTVAAADLNSNSAKLVAQEAGANASAHYVDVSDYEAVKALRDGVLTAHGQIDILVNNAGIATAPAPFADTSIVAFRKVLDVNLLGMIHGTSAFLADLASRPEASLVNVSSYTGLLGTTHLVAYSTSKFGVRGFTEAMRMELAGTPIAVTLVMPGMTHTSMMANSPLVEDGRRGALQAAFDSATGVSPDVVAKAVIKAIRKRKPRVLVGKDTKALDVLTRMMPGRYSALLAKPMRTIVENTFS